MKFTKMQGAGNDFVVVETNDIERDWSRLAIAMCDRHYGIGADGLLLLTPSTVADFGMRIFNADGSEASACGNGLRCLVVKHFVDGRLARSGEHEVLVETVAGVRKALVNQAGGKITKVQIGMGVPKFGAKDIPVVIEPNEANLVDIKLMITYLMTVDARKLDLNLVSVGNPHAVYFRWKSLSDFPLAQLGPKIERHRIFPKRVNFEVAQVVNRGQVEARVWEIGVGETLACGSGACAITVVAQLKGYVDRKVTVKLPGGILEVNWDGVGEVFLSGPAETVFTGEWRDGQT